jgi:hypothetical protein
LEKRLAVFDPFVSYTPRMGNPKIMLKLKGAVEPKTELEVVTQHLPGSIVEFYKNRDFRRIEGQITGNDQLWLGGN